MKKTILFLSLIVFVFAISTTNAQSLRIGPAIGLTTVQESGIFSPELPDLDNNIHYGIKAKVGIPMVPVKIVGHILYTSFEASGTAVLPVLVPPSEGSVNNEVILESSLLSVGIGGEWTLIPGPIQPYFGADFLISSFGESKISYENVFEATGDGNSRYGIGIGAGIDFKLLPTIDVDVCAKYNFNNLIGKDDLEENFNTITISANILFGIL